MNRSAEIYIKAIDSFIVEDSYVPSAEYTFCHVFAQDVMNHPAIKAPLPVGRADEIYRQILDDESTKWCDVAFSEAQDRANQGIPTIAISHFPCHVAVVRPHGGTVVTETGKVKIAQAGFVNFNDNTLDCGWSEEDQPNIKFYSWFD